MTIGSLKVELLIGDATSLKDKRRVVMSVKEKLKRRFEVAVAEVEKQDVHQMAVLGVVAVSNEGKHVQSVLSKVMDFLRADGRYVVCGHQIDVFTDN